MSWKATAFVNEITEGITVYEKMVMLVLSDFHHTTSKAAWPSLKELAKRSLMSESAVCRILARLEEKQFLQRLSGGGSGNRSKYLFAGLDFKNTDPESVFENQETLTKTLTKTLTPDAINTDPGDSAIRKERVEPVNTPVKERGEPPHELHALEYARGLCETIGLPCKGNLEIIADAVTAVGKLQKVPREEAYAFLMDKAGEAVLRGEAVDRWWFQDAKWRRNGEQSSKAKQRQTERREILTATLRNRYSGHAGPSSSADGQGVHTGGDGGLVRAAGKAAGSSD